ncbi:MAG: alpha-L-glutamate ligase-like protein [Gammaproteobacteria bacterium]
MSLWKTYKQLKKAGILGMNRRNADYIMLYNPRHKYPLVDNKLSTKSLAQTANIAVPTLYHVVEREHQIAELEQVLSQYADFVVKPAHGSGGEGIVVISGRRGNRYQKVNGLLMYQDELNHHISNILSGMYSLGGQADHAIIEYRVEFDPLFEAVSYQGVPDIRVIVLAGYPVMAMVRLPTRASQGKANLHQGAVGTGIDLKTGKTLHGVLHNQLIEQHPDTGNPIAGLQIPGWHSLLEISASCFELTGLGYLGVDLVLDKNRGPLMLELNARPGLSIQIANRAGLVPRLQFVEKNRDPSLTPSQRVDFIMENLSGFPSID